MSLEDEVRSLAVAAKELSAAAKDLKGGGGGGGVGGGVAAGRSFVGATGPGGVALAAAGLAADAINGAASFLTPAANAYAVTGSSAALATAVNQSLLGAVGNTAIGGFALALTGVSAAKETTERAGRDVSSVTEDIARYGEEVSPELRKSLADVALEQEKRVTKERGEVAALTGSTEALKDARPAGAGAGFDMVVSVLERIENAINSWGGGRH